MGVLIIKILLFRVLYWGPLSSETPVWLFEIDKSRRSKLNPNHNDICKAGSLASGGIARFVAWPRKGLRVSGSEALGLGFCGGQFRVWGFGPLGLGLSRLRGFGVPGLEVEVVIGGFEGLAV